MALNWAMLTDDGSRPVPLPGEKIFFSVERCSVALDFKASGVKWSANGNAFVTSQRIVFLRQSPLPAPADPSLMSAHLRSLSVPLAQFVDTRYLIPVFTAPYFEATVVPSPDGGLPQRTSAGASTGLFKLWFNEGGGMAFRDAVEEVKSRLDEGSSHIEALPLYEPREQTGSQGTNTPAQVQSAIASMSLNQASNAGARQPPDRRPTRSDSMPWPEDMEAARVAREAEERERDGELPRAPQAGAAQTSSASPAQERREEQPPPYPA